MTKPLQVKPKTKLKKARRKPRLLPAIGWREWLALPQLGISGIKAKIDTGAHSSSLHAFNLKLFLRDGATWLRFDLHPLQRNARTTVRAEALMIDERWVRSSNGERSLRPVIATPIVLGDDAWSIEMTLVRRDLMGFRMLLGRHAIRNRYLVDCGRSFLKGRPPRAAVSPDKES